MFILNTEVESKERYDLRKFVETVETVDFFTHSIENDLNTSWFVQQLNLLPVQGTRPVGAQAEFRPDLLSYDIFKDTQYWELLLLYNNIFDFTDLKSNLTVRYFRISDLENLFFTAKSKQSGKS